MGTVRVGKEEVNLDESALQFNQDNINEFLSGYASLHRFYQNKHSDATYIAKTLSDRHAVLLNSKLRDYKVMNHLSDKMAEASAKADPEVVALLEKVRTAEYVKDELQGFLKSMDYAFQNSKEFCYNLRKEMDKIFGKNVMSSDTRSGLEEKMKGLYSSPT